MSALALKADMLRAGRRLSLVPAADNERSQMRTVFTVAISSGNPEFSRGLSRGPVRLSTGDVETAIPLGEAFGFADALLARPRVSLIAETYDMNGEPVARHRGAAYPRSHGDLPQRLFAVCHTSTITPGLVAIIKDPSRLFHAEVSGVLPAGTK